MTNQVLPEPGDDPEKDALTQPLDGQALPARAPPPRITCVGWARLAAVWICCTIAAGLMPGQALFVSMFAEAGVFGGACTESEPAPCDAQVAQVSSMLGTGMLVGMASIVPAGLLFDIYGARWLGSVGAVIVVIGLSLEAVAVFSAIGGTDAYTNWLVLVAAMVTDFGSMLNSYCFLGLVWFYPGSMTLILSLSTATYQVSALLPVGLECIMNWTGIHLGVALLLFAAAAAATVPVVLALLPTQKEYYQQAEALLGVPLPKPKAGFDMVNKLRLGWKAVSQDMRDHLFLCLGFSFSFAIATLYNSMSSAYGKHLFGTQKDGDRLAEMQVEATAIVGGAVAPFAGQIIDCIGLSRFLWVMALFVGVPFALFSTPEWWAAWATTFGYVSFSTLGQLFLNSYLLNYSPPNRLGSYSGVLINLIMFLMMPAYFAAFTFMSVMPEDQRFFWPFIVTNAAALASLVVFNVRFCFAHGGRGVPDMPRMLPEDELELCMPFGATTLDEACVILGIEDKKALLKKLANPDPLTMVDLMSRVDLDKVGDNFAKHDADDFIKLLEAAPEEDEDEEVTAGSAAAASPSSGEQASLLAADASPRDSNAPTDVPADAAEEDPVATRALMYAKDMREAFRTGGPEQRAAVLNEARSEEDIGLNGITARMLGECMRKMTDEGDAAGLKQYLLETPVNDQVKAYFGMEEWLSKEENKQLEKKFNKLVPPKEFAKMVKENKALKDFVAQVMKREVKRSMNRLTGRK